MVTSDRGGAVKRQRHYVEMEHCCMIVCSQWGKHGLVSFSLEHIFISHYDKNMMQRCRSKYKHKNQVLDCNTGLRKPILT